LRSLRAQEGETHVLIRRRSGPERLPLVIWFRMGCCLGPNSCKPAREKKKKIDAHHICSNKENAMEKHAEEICLQF